MLWDAVCTFPAGQGIPVILIFGVLNVHFVMVYFLSEEWASNEYIVSLFGNISVGLFYYLFSVTLPSEIACSLPI